MTIRVIVGDATQVRGLSALVVPANKQLRLGWGSHLAEKVLKLAGRSVEDEALAEHPRGIALGEAVLTGAGALPGFTHLVHAAVLDRYDLNPLFLLKLRQRTSPETLARATRASLELVSRAGLHGLVFTPMGAGIGGMSDAQCAAVMVGAMREWLAANPGPPVTEVVVACLSERAAEAFRRGLAAHSA